MVENITIMLNGKPVEISRILKDGTNYVGRSRRGMRVNKDGVQTEAVVG
jgi:hypothetical protein